MRSGNPKGAGSASSEENVATFAETMPSVWQTGCLPDIAMRHDVFVQRVIRVSSVVSWS
jgi:hypothetical protein